jgi:hypothetical protein
VTSGQPHGEQVRWSASTENAAPASGSAVGADGPTRVLRRPTSADKTRRLDSVPGHRPLIDRAGDALARQPRDLLLRYRRLEEHQRGIVVALAALGAFLLVVALLSGGTTAGETHEPSHSGQHQLSP